MDKLETQGREDNSYLCRFVLKEIQVVPEIVRVWSCSFLSGILSNMALQAPEFWNTQRDLSKIELQNFNLSTLPIFLFKQASAIQSLDLSRNPSIHDLPSDFVQLLLGIKSLILQQNQLLKCPKSIYILTTLHILDLSKNRIKDLNESLLGQLVGLGEVNLESNLLEKLPQDFCRECVSVKILKLGNNRFRDFPIELCVLGGGRPTAISRSLEVLDLNFNRLIGSLPEELGRLTNLREFSCVGNRLVGGIPRSLGLCKNLQVLDLRSNGLGDEDGRGVLNGVTLCPALTCLKLDGNCLNLSDMGEVSLKKLEHFGLSQQTIIRKDSSGIASSISQSQEPKLGSIFRPLDLGCHLSSLDMSYCSLTELPVTFFDNLVALKVLRLTGNALKELPPFASQNSRTATIALTELHVSLNDLDILSDDLSDLCNLEILDVSGNRLLDLPATIWRLGLLHVLNASCNLLTSLPLPFSDDDSISPTLSMLTENLPSSFATDSARLSVTPSVRSSVAYTWKTLPPLSKSLRELYLADNQLNDEVYAALYLLPKLRKLNMAFNEVADLSSWLVQMPQSRLSAAASNYSSLSGPWYGDLEELYLSGNGISFLPIEIEKCSRLRWLVLAGNKLGTVPGELSKLQNLIALDLAAQLGARGEGTGLRYNVSNVPYDYNWYVL